MAPSQRNDIDYPLKQDYDQMTPNRSRDVLRGGLPKDACQQHVWNELSPRRLLLLEHLLINGAAV